MSYFPTGPSQFWGPNPEMLNGNPVPQPINRYQGNFIPHEIVGYQTPIPSSHFGSVDLNAYQHPRWVNGRNYVPQKNYQSINNIQNIAVQQFSPPSIQPHPFALNLQQIQPVSQINSGKRKRVEASQDCEDEKSHINQRIQKLNEKIQAFTQELSLIKTDPSLKQKWEEVEVAVACQMQELKDFDLNMKNLFSNYEQLLKIQNNLHAENQQLKNDLEIWKSDCVGIQERAKTSVSAEASQSLPLDPTNAVETINEFTASGKELVEVSQELLKAVNKKKDFSKKEVSELAKKINKLASQVNTNLAGAKEAIKQLSRVNQELKNPQSKEEQRLKEIIKKNESEIYELNLWLRKYKEVNDANAKTAEENLNKFKQMQGIDPTKLQERVVIVYWSNQKESVTIDGKDISLQTDELKKCALQSIGNGKAIDPNVNFSLDQPQQQPHNKVNGGGAFPTELPGDDVVFF